MNPALGAFLGALFGLSVWLLVEGMRPRTGLPAEKARGGLSDKVRSMLRRPAGSAGTQRDIKIAIAVVGAVGAYVVSGWVIMLMLVPLTVWGLPKLFHDPNKARIDRLAAVESWIRQVRSLLVGGADNTLEAALVASLPSTPAPIHAEVKRLVARINARWTTDRALAAFAEDMDDSVADSVAAAMMLAYYRRGGGLIDVIDALADSVRDEVEARRKQESAKSGVRTSVRYMTLLVVVGVPAMMLAAPTYLQPYRSAFGQMLALVFAAGYVGGLILLRQLSLVKDKPRIYPRIRPSGQRGLA